MLVEKLNEYMSESTFKKYETFNTIDELNETVKWYISNKRQILNKNAVRILRYLKDYSRKYKGVSFRTKNNIADDLGISRKTVIRNCNLMEQLGIIRQVSTRRNTDKRQSANIIIIQVSHEMKSVLENDKNNNYATDSYIEEILRDNFIKMGLNKQLLMDTQKWFTINGRTYRVDFYIEGVNNKGEKFKLVIECDGHEFHEKTKEQAQRDKKRDRDFISNGIITLRFTGSEIKENPINCVKEIKEILEYLKG